jgi:hypothetical protein
MKIDVDATKLSTYAMKVVETKIRQSVKQQLERDIDYMVDLSSLVGKLSILSEKMNRVEETLHIMQDIMKKKRIM